MRAEGARSSKRTFSARIIVNDLHPEVSPLATFDARLQRRAMLVLKETHWR